MMTSDSCADISRYQTSVDFTAMSAVIHLLILRVTYGVNVDAQYKGRPELARSVGIATGGYHFLRAGNIDDQANLFMKTMPVVKGALCALDWETEKDHTLPTADEALRWLQIVEKATGVKPLLYSTTSLLDAHVPSGHGLHAYPLWLARYPTVDGKMVKSWSSDLNIGALPKGWSGSQVLLWQYTGGGSVPGVSGDCDRSVGDVDGVIAKYPASRTGKSSAL